MQKKEIYQELKEVEIEALDYDIMALACVHIQVKKNQSIVFHRHLRLIDVVMTVKIFSRCLLNVPSNRCVVLFWGCIEIHYNYALRPFKMALIKTDIYVRFVYLHEVLYSR